MVNTMTYCYGAAPLLVSGVLRTEVRSVGQRLLDALVDGGVSIPRRARRRRYRAMEKSREAAERLAVDCIAIFKLYLEAIRTVFPKSSN